MHSRSTLKWLKVRKKIGRGVLACSLTVFFWERSWWFSLSASWRLPIPLSSKEPLAHLFFHANIFLSVCLSVHWERLRIVLAYQMLKNHLWYLRRKKHKPTESKSNLSSWDRKHLQLSSSCDGGGELKREKKHWTEIKFAFRCDQDIIYGDYYAITVADRQRFALICTRYMHISVCMGAMNWDSFLKQSAQDQFTHIALKQIVLCVWYLFFSFSIF